MKLNIQASQKEAFQKSCIEVGLTCQFHEIEKHGMVAVYVTDEKLGEVIPKIAFYLGLNFGFELHKELGVNI